MVVQGVQSQPRIDERNPVSEGVWLLAVNGSTALYSSGANKSHLNTKISVSFPLSPDFYEEAHTWNSFFAKLSSPNFPPILSTARKSKMQHKTINKFYLNFKDKKVFLWKSQFQI